MPEPRVLHQELGLCFLHEWLLGRVPGSPLAVIEEEFPTTAQSSLSGQRDCIFPETLVLPRNLHDHRVKHECRVGS